MDIRTDGAVPAIAARCPMRDGRKMNDVLTSIRDYAGQDLSFGEGRGGFLSGPLSYELAHVSGEHGGKIVCSWERARSILLKLRAGPPKIVSYYTVDTPYEDMAAELATSLDRFGIPYEMEPHESRGSWVANTCLKSESILRLWRASDGPVCWLDADSTVAREPWFLYDSPFDFAIVKKKGWWFMSGMVYLAKTDAVEALLLEWTALCKRYPYIWDQALLSYAWYNVARRREVKTLWLPEDIFRIPPRGTPFKAWLKALRTRWIKRPLRREVPKFFLQKQASRTQKKAMNIEAGHFEISMGGIAPDFREALATFDFSRDFSAEEVFPEIVGHEATLE